MASEQDVLQALSGIAGPDGRSALSRSNGVAGLTVRGEKIYLALAGNARLPEAMETMRLEAERVIKALPGVASAIVSLTAERSSGAPAPATPPRAAPAKDIGIPGIKRIVAVASGKGGVGKSTTTVNVALALTGLGWRVGVLDADVYGPSVPRLLGLQGKPELEGKMLQPLSAYGLKAMSIGLLVGEEQAVVWRGPMVMSAINQLLREVNWGELDCLLVDMPPGTGDAQLSLSQAVPLAGAVIVSTPQDLALIDARRGITMFKQVSVPILGIVENMSTFICPHCGGQSDIFAHGGAKAEAQRLGVPFLGAVPLSIAIREQSDSGRPIVASDPNGVQAAAYRDIAGRIKTGFDTARSRAAPRITIE